MINEFKLGNVYSIQGGGDWIKLKKDVIVSAITEMEECDRLEIDLFAEAFEEYGVNDTTYSSYLSKNYKVYHCKVVSDRTLDGIDSASDDFYFMEVMLDKALCFELLPCTVYKWEITSTPYVKTDYLKDIDQNDLKFENMVKTIDIKQIINSALTEVFPETMTDKKNEQTIFMTTEEYELVKTQRNNVYQHGQRVKFDRVMSDNLKQQSLINSISEYNKKLSSIKTKEKEIDTKLNQVYAIEKMNTENADNNANVKAVLKEIFNRIKMNPTIPNNPFENFVDFDEYYGSITF